MSHTPYRCRRAGRTTTVAGTLVIAASPLVFCNHRECGSHHDLPEEVGIYAALTEPTVRAITTSGSMPLSGVSASGAVGNLTASCS